METIAHYYIPTAYDIIRRYVDYTYGKEQSAIYHHGCGESFVGNFTPQGTWVRADFSIAHFAERHCLYTTTMSVRILLRRTSWCRRT
ncbi:hypothetical protein [uncultured Veillonella sp.]|uniref:hypothetical protein n=1 Tax=uncultured Veillonella sp. TaxID=159268 RepID=UPI002805CC64|nr:hypothetical protein [uncultured Veillonella sp.]